MNNENWMNSNKIVLFRWLFYFFFRGFEIKPIIHSLVHTVWHKKQHYDNSTKILCTYAMWPMMSRLFFTNVFALIFLLRFLWKSHMFFIKKKLQFSTHHTGTQTTLFPNRRINVLFLKQPENSTNFIRTQKIKHFF